MNSYIVCLTLKESVEFDKRGGRYTSFQRNIPKTVTELYKRAVKVLIYRHHPKYKSQPRPKDYLISPFPKELDNDLMKIKQVAMDGIEEGNLIFERATDDEFNELANCGFFYKLPDNHRNFFCFLHLTLQEFLAASKVVTDDMQNVEQFLAAHLENPRWYLVIQFVAGLVGNKIKKAKKSGSSVVDDSERKKIRGNIVNR